MPPLKFTTKKIPTEFNRGWAKKLYSMARQASAERAWASIKRFYDNCKNPSLKKKGFPKFKKARSVESGNILHNIDTKKATQWENSCLCDLCDLYLSPFLT